MNLDFAKIRQGLDLLNRASAVRDKIVEMTNTPADTPPGINVLRIDGNQDLDISAVLIRNAVLNVWQAKRDQLATDGRNLIQQGVT